MCPGEKFIVHHHCYCPWEALIEHFLYAKHYARSWGYEKVYNNYSLQNIKAVGESGSMQEMVAHDEQQTLAADNLKNSESGAVFKSSKLQEEPASGIEEQEGILNP